MNMMEWNTLQKYIESGIEWILTPFYLVFLMAGILLMMLVGLLIMPYYIFLEFDDE